MVKLKNNSKLKAEKNANILNNLKISKWKHKGIVKIQSKQKQN